MKKLIITLALSMALVIPITASASDSLKSDSPSVENALTFNAQDRAINDSDIESLDVEQVVYSKTSKTFSTTANLNLRSNANDKSRVIKTLKKGSSVVELSNKSGWKKVKSGKSIGWVSAKYLKESRQNVVKNSKSSTKINVHSVKSISQAKKWISQTCSQVKVKTIPGKTSYYKPGENTIVLGSNVSGIYMANVVTHEMAHHYQWVYYRGDVVKWNKDLRPSKGKPSKIEVQADHMSYEAMGFKPHPLSYTKVKATASQKKEAQKIISYGKSKGC